MKIKNYTGREVKIILEDEIKTIPMDGEPPHVNIRRTALDKIDGINIVQQQIKSIEGLPEKTEGVLYIVSKIVAMYSNREDFVVVDDLVRETSSRKVQACKNLAFLPLEKTN